MKVISQLYRQWAIDCRHKDFISAVTRLLQIGVIDRPVDILYPDTWDKCTKALAEDTMSSSSAKNPKSWGKVVQVLQTALQEQETWKAAQKRLFAMARLGIGVATQTARAADSSELSDSQERERPSSPSRLLGSALECSPARDPPVEQQKLSWDETIDELRHAID